MSAYVLSGHDNNWHLLRNRTDVKRCAQCHTLLAKWDEDLNHRERARGLPKYDFSYTYDGVAVCSARFVSIVEGAGLKGLDFHPLFGGFSWMRPTESVRFDAKKRGTRFENYCAACGQYESVIGATPAYLIDGEVVPDDGFVRTDLEFGSACVDEKGPLILCGQSAATVLRTARLSGLELNALQTSN